MSCTIEADPDIAGVGVRVAVYAQAFFCIIPSVLLALFGPVPDRNYAAVVKKTYQEGRAVVATMLVTNVALLTVALYKAAAGTLTRYHAAIILYLNWIVFLGAVLSSITLAYSHPLRIKPGFAAWHRLMVVPFVRRSRQAAIDEMHRAQGALHGLFQSRVRLSKVLDTEQHFVFLSIHIFGIGVLGVILFSNSGGFERHVPCNTDIVLWTFGLLRSISGPAMQHFWFAIYVVALIPVANITLCVVLTVLPCMPLLWLLLAFLHHMKKRTLDRLTVTIARLGIVLPFLALIALLIAATEKTISANRSTNAVGPEESQWGFGQILAIVLLVAPALGTVNRVIVILTDVTVLFPEFPARVAESDPYHSVRRQSASQFATVRYLTWRGNIANRTTTRDDERVLNHPFTPSQSGMHTVPVVERTATLTGYSAEEVLRAIVIKGMREHWDTGLDHDGVLKRYDADTDQCYAVMKPVSPSTEPRDFVLVQQVVRRQNQTIEVTRASMDPMVDDLPKQPGRIRARLEFEGWIIEPRANGVRLTCVRQLALEDRLPLATARDMARRSLFYPGKIGWTLRNYGFGAVLDVHPTVGVIEGERMDTETGTYTATFRTIAAGAVTVQYDIARRLQYYQGANASSKVIEGEPQDLAHVDNPGTGQLTLNVAAAEMVVEVTVFRTRRLT